jgi:phosphoserine/homoserine phosphotransferase
MLTQADVGILFRPPQNVINDFPQFSVTNDYRELQEILRQYL